MRAPSARRSRRRLRTPWPWLLLAGFFLADAWRLRARARALGVADPVEAASGAADHEVADLEYDCVTACGVDVDDPTRHAASAFARANGLEVLDLVPADLPTEQVLDLLRQVDPSTYTANPLAPGRGPRQATLVHRSVSSRAGLADDERLEAGTYVGTIAELKKFAPTRAGLGIARGVTASDDMLTTHRANLVATHKKAAPFVAAAPVAQVGLLGLGVVLAPPWGLIALASYCAQPHLVTAGTGLRPRDRTPLAALTRPFRRSADSVHLVRAAAVDVDGLVAAEEQTAERQTVEYGTLLTGGVDRFFEPRRDTCPWCGDTSLRERLRTTDLLQCKPGTFVLDECSSCAHIFQNPRLTPEGLEFYYGDFYDGEGIDPTEFAWTADDRAYRGRVKLVQAKTEPKRWLDVGAGHGHFCLVASTMLPRTTFEALDMGDGLLSAERHRWVEKAHLGMFPELAGSLEGTFDVVSMHHYLEHTRDPLAEIAAAATVLEPGGWLSIEVPDPECVFGRWFGRLWGPWFQPQHQHFLSMRNLSDALTRRGFTVVTVERGPAHIPTDLAFSTLLFANRAAGPPRKPWTEPTGAVARTRRAVCFPALAALVVPAYVLDQVVAPLVRSRPGGPNAYRILAQKVASDVA